MELRWTLQEIYSISAAFISGLSESKHYQALLAFHIFLLTSCGGRA